jgi:acyl-CoA synthetase (AMP-forming)/AMP-acid ligase II
MPDTVAHLIRTCAERSSAKLAIIDPSARITYGELDASSRSLAAGFVAAGVGKGSRVGLLMPNGIPWVRIAVALMRIGAVLVPLSTLLQPGELIAHLRTASVRHLVSVPEFRGNRYLDGLDTDQLAALRNVWAADDGWQPAGSAAARRVADALSATVRPSDPLAVMFTSGSSGAPKGVIHSHGNALGAVRSGLAARRIDYGCWNGSASRCFAAGRIRPRRWPGTPRMPAPTSRTCGRAVWSRCCRHDCAPGRALGPNSSG